MSEAPEDRLIDAIYDMIDEKVESAVKQREWKEIKEVKNEIKAEVQTYLYFEMESMQRRLDAAVELITGKSLADLVDDAARREGER